MHRRDQTKQLVRKANDCFGMAISNLELNDEADWNYERSVLDVAIYISLNILELILYYRVIDGKDQPLKKHEADQVDRGNWEKFLKNHNRTALKYLKKIDQLERI